MSTLCFSLCDGDGGESCADCSGDFSDGEAFLDELEYAECYVRSVGQECHAVSSEVILDSGADVTVLPMDVFGHVGQAGESDTVLSRFLCVGPRTPCQSTELKRQVFGRLLS